MFPSTNFLLPFSQVISRNGYRAIRHVSRKSSPAKKQEALSAEDMERFLQMEESKALGFDPWAQPVAMFDLHVPTPWSTLLKQARLRDSLRLVRSGLENKISNAISMFRMARTHSLPWNPMVSPYSPQIFRSASTKPDTWLKPLRDISHNSYEQIHKAMASNDVQTVRKLSNGAYQKRLLARMKALHPTTTQKVSMPKNTSSSRYTWRLHSLASPIQCVSIRCGQGHLGKRDPQIGTRYIVQACMKFDTLQSLTLLSSPSLSSPEPKRVLEYLVFEKKMWYDSPWIIRDQLWEGFLGEK